MWLKHWRDDSVNDFRVFAAAGAQISDIRQRIVERYAGQRQLFVLTSEESRRYVLRITAQWFGLMNVQVIPEMARKLQETVAHNVETLLDLEVRRTTVFVDEVEAPVESS